MPVALRIPLFGAPPSHPYQHASGLRALVLRWIQTEDPELSQRIHDADQAKPYSLSPLWTDPHTHTNWFDISVLADPILQPLVRGMAQSSDEVRLGPQRFRPGRPEVVREEGWKELLAPAPPHVRHLDFRLLSPTANHSSGTEFRKSIVLPTPELYFGSWWRRWEVCSDVEIHPELLDVVARQVVVTACEGKTQCVRLDDSRSFIGFTGWVRFSILKPETLSLDVKKALLALARFSTYCGTGVETMRGMGKTELAHSQL